MGAWHVEGATEVCQCVRCMKVQVLLIVSAAGAAAPPVTFSQEQ